MHPAYSVIFFTTASGAGYGLLAWLGLLYPLGLIPREPAFGFAALAIALALVTAGLLSSTAHLGRPERAWRAFSQWRSSWLSREGVAAIAAYIPAGILGVGWVLFPLPGAVTGTAALVAAALALVVVGCTGMIYASLPTIPAWHQPLVAPVYIILALATGALLLDFVLLSFGAGSEWMPWIAIATLCLGWVAKTAYWSAVDAAPPPATLEQATGLGALGTVRPLDPPHTQANYVMREMGYVVGRRHAGRLRRAAVVLLFAVPAACSALVLGVGPGAGLILAFSAVASAAGGVFIERWLFFAEAEHVSMVYYGRPRGRGEAARGGLKREAEAPYCKDGPA
jgi:DMSO reductase anchor subunit